MMLYIALIYIQARYIAKYEAIKNVLQSGKLLV